MVAARDKSSPCFDEEEIYEKIEAPKWVDFTTPEKSLPDDFAWFCLRAGCKQDHDESMDPVTLSANFLRRVMEARSPNIRLGKASILTPHAISKYPFSAPAKSRIPRLHDTGRKGVPEPVVRKLISIPSKRVSSPRKVRSGKAAKTTNRKKCLKKSGSFRSLRNSKVLISLKGHVRPVAKILVFHTPNRTRKPTKAEAITSSAARAELKKFETEREGNTQLAVGHTCKSSRCAANNPNYNKPVSVPAKIRPQAHKQPTKQEQQAPTMNSKNPEASVAESKHDQQVHQESLLFDGTMLGKKSSGAGNRNVVQRSSGKQSCCSIEMDLDRSSRNRSLEICYEMNCTVNEESETLEQNQPIREVADEALEILKEAATASNQEVIQNKTANANLVKCDPAQHENGVKEEAELRNKSEDMNYRETTDRSSAYDLASEVGEFKVRLENEKDVHDSAVTPSTQQYMENSIGTENLVQKEHGQIDQTCNGLEDDKEINDTESAIELAKEESCTKHQNEKRKGITTSYMRSGKKRSILNSVNISNLDPQERKSERKGLKDMALDDFDDAENENKENTSVSANNSNLSSINYNSENGPGKKNLYEIPKKILEAPAEKISKGTNSARMERKTPKFTNPKPFRFRTNERGILREANLEKKKLQALENFADIQTKQINPILTETEKALQQTQQYRNVGAKQMHTESRKKVVKSRYLASGKSKHPKDSDSPQKTLEKSHETETITYQAKDQTSDMPPVQAQLTRVLKPRKRWNTPAALREKIVADANDGSVLSRQDALRTIEIAAENSPCTKSKSCLRGIRPPTIPNGPNLRTVHRRPVLQRNQQMTML